MKYENPDMKIIAFEAKEAIANEIDVDFGSMISKNSTPTG